MPSKIKSIDTLAIFWIIHILIISIIYLLVNQPKEILDSSTWILLLWVFFVVSIPSLLTMVLVHFLLYSVDEKYKRYGIRLMSFIAFLVTFELWKATDSQTNFLNPYFKETFAWAAALLATSHILSYQFIRRLRKPTEAVVNS